MTKISLNKKQAEAANTLSGPVLVLAGAGAGKTMTLTARIIKLIISGVMPQNILAITFTNKASGEMKERVNKALLNNSKLNFPISEIDNGFKPFVSTFHSLGVYILRENHHKLNISKYFNIYDRNDTKKALKEALNNLNLDPKEWELKMLVSIISKNKGNGVTHKTFSNEIQNSNNQKNIADIWIEYEKIKEKENALDFDDLLLKTALLLQNNEDIRNHYLKKWTHIHVDEYQDTNKIQNKIIELLINPKTKNIFAVGDDDQSIYGWRGSEIKNILEFEKKHKAKKIFMEQNYRSTKNIIEASNYVIEKNKERYPKRLFSEKQDGEKIILHTAFTEKEEALYIAKEIKKILKENKKINENDIAILYRANFQSRALEEAMLSENIPYQVLGTKFFDRAEVKDVMSYIKASQNPNSLTDLKRIINSPKRGLGTASIIKIFSENLDSLSPKAKKSYSDFQKILSEIKEYSQNHTPSEIVKFTIKKSGLEDFFLNQKSDEAMEKLANTYELAVFAQKYDDFEQNEALLTFFEDVALISDQDSKKDLEKKPMVKLMTIHASKGLEFNTVFLSGAEEALFSPQDFSDQKEAISKTEEERRLFYVAMTRAKEKLYLTLSATRTVYGKTEQNEECSFIADIPDKFLERSSTFGDISFSDNDEIEFLEW